MLTEIIIAAAISLYLTITGWLLLSEGNHEKRDFLEKDASWWLILIVFPGAIFWNLTMMIIVFSLWLWDIITETMGINRNDD